MYKLFISKALFIVILVAPLLVQANTHIKTDRNTNNLIFLSDTISRQKQDTKKNGSKKDADNKEKPDNKQAPNKPEIKQVPKSRKQARPKVIVKPNVKAKPKINRPTIKRP